MMTNYIEVGQTMGGDVYTIWKENIGPRTLEIKCEPWELKMPKYYVDWPNIDHMLNIKQGAAWDRRIRELRLVVKLLNSGHYDGVEPADFINNILCSI